MLSYEAERNYRKLREFADNIDIGDQVWLPEEKMGIAHDSMFVDGMWFTVREKYPSVVLLEKRTKRNEIHRQSASYVNIWMHGKVRRR